MLLYNSTFKIQHLKFHLFRSLHINRMMASIQINNDRDRCCRFCCCNGDHEYGKEKTVQPVGPEIFVECNEIQVNAVQYQFDTHQHGNEVSSGEETIHTDEEKRDADKENMI